MRRDKRGLRGNNKNTPSPPNGSLHPTATLTAFADILCVVCVLDSKKKKERAFDEKAIDPQLTENTNFPS